MSTAAPRPSRARRRPNAPPGRVHAARAGILETRVYRGPNYWSYEPAIKLIVDLGDARAVPDQPIPGFTERLLEILPGVGQHTCGRGASAASTSGCAKARGSGTSRSTSPSSCSARPAPRSPAARPAAPASRAATTSSTLTRGDVGLAAGQARRPAGQPPRPGRAGLRLRRRAGEAHPARRAARLRALDPGASSTRRRSATSPGSGSTSRRSSSSATASTRSGSGPR